jgi:hypothetical protein
MKTGTMKALKTRAAIRVRTADEKGGGCRTTKIKIDGTVEVATRDGWLCFWTAGREIRIGPLTPEQAENLCEDLGYDAVE